MNIFLFRKPRFYAIIIAMPCKIGKSHPWRALYANYRITEHPSELIQQLLAIWESAVRTIHLFLSDHEILNIKNMYYVPQAIRDIPCLVIAIDETNFPIAFMGIAGHKLEMLFVSAAARGNGIGKALMHYGMTAYSICEVAVNEQNPLACGFYEHMGFPYLCANRPR